MGSGHPTRLGLRHRILRRAVRGLSGALLGLSVVSGALVMSGATGIGVAPAADSALSCTAIWTGGAGTPEWANAGNWSTGVVPDGTGVDVCIPGGTTVVDQSAVTVAELTIANGSSLTVGTAGGTGTKPVGATLTVTSGLDNEGTLTAGTSGAGTTLALDGPVTNTGAFEVFGTLIVGATAATGVTNAGSVGIAPGGVIDLERASVFTNAANGLLAFGIDGPPTSASNFGRILHGSLSLDGSAAPVLEGGFVPAPAAEYLVATGSFSGTFATVRNDGTADYSHPDALGLVGGQPATATATTVEATDAATTSVFGQHVRFTATVRPAAGTTPTGWVSFTAGGLLIGSTSVTTAAGVTTASIDTAALPVGSQPVSARYDGDVLFGPSISPADTLTVRPDPTHVTLAAAPTPAAPGEPVTYSVAVGADAPGAGPAAGTVSLSDNGTLVPGCESLTLPTTDPGQVACKEIYGTDGTHSVVAAYSGSADFLPSTTAVSETVAPRPTTTSITVSPRSSTTGEPVSFTASVDASVGSPTGIVTFTDNGSVVGTSTLTTTDGMTTTSMLLTTLPLGANSISAFFGGDANFAASTSGAAQVTVDRAATALNLVSSDELTSSGQPVTFIANVFPTTGSGETGTVTFFDHGMPIGTADVANGQATLTTAMLPIGTGSITAHYGGDAGFAGSATASAWSQEVDPSPG